MDITKLVRDRRQVSAAVKIVGDAAVAVKDLRILFPVRFEEHQLATVGATVHVVGHYVGIVDDTFYSPCSVNAMMPLSPTSISRLTLDGADYYDLFFAKGSEVIPNVNLVKRDVLTYFIYNEFVAAGKVPWYMNYLDMCMLFESALIHAGAAIGKNQEVIELIMSMIARDPKNITLYYRHTIETLDDVFNRPASFIPLRSILGATNTTSRLAGSYMTEGIISALNNPSDKEERIEKLLRS